MSSSNFSETEQTFKFIKNFTCSIPLTKTVLNAKNQNGSEKIILFDSINNSEKSMRKSLNIAYGLNKKKYVFLGKNSHVTLSDYNYNKIYIL